MNLDYSPQLSFFIKALKKCRINTNFFTPKQIEEFLKSEKDLNIEKLSLKSLFFALKSEIKAGVIYHATTSFELCYTAFLLPDKFNSLIVFGPYLSQAIYNEHLLEIIEKNKLTIKDLVFFQEFLTIIPIVAKESAVFNFEEALYESIWQNMPFTYKSLSVEAQASESEFNYLIKADESNFTKANVHILEERYFAENSMMEAISQGQVSKINHLIANFNESNIKKRLPSLLRDLKNYAIITNTLARKSAEKGGVHPVYLDSTSSRFALLIEQATSSKQCVDLIKDIFSSYCQLVCNYNTKDQSPIVRKTVLYILANLSENITLSSIAKEQNVSKEYLSTVFKRDTGKTVTQFITEKRINYAKQLLENTVLKIQTISQLCGILDLQYFTKQFKKVVGLTPNAYRESVKQ